MRKLRVAALAASLAAFPAAAHAQADSAHPQGADQAQHDHSASSAGEGQATPSAMPRPQMRDGMHMENCGCPCCEMMRQHGGGMTHPGEGETPDASPAQPEDHQH